MATMSWRARISYIFVLNFLSLNLYSRLLLSHRLTDAPKKRHCQQAYQPSLNTSTMDASDIVLQGISTSLFLTLFIIPAAIHILAWCACLICRSIIQLLEQEEGRNQKSATKT